MSITTQETVTFTGIRSNATDRAKLAQAGFVHVTGLKTHSQITGTEYIIGEKTGPNEIGKWNSNNGMIVFVTVGGEVWIRYGAGFFDQAINNELVDEICPNGRGAYVPLSNGETIHSHDLLKRLVDPYSGLNIPASV